MKKIMISIAAVCCIFTAAAKVPSGWTTNYDAALKQAKAEKKKVLILFTGSDWCSWCKQLRKNVLDKGVFEKYAKENLVLVYFDFPNNRKIANSQMGIQQSMAKKFGIKGFPTTVVIDAQGRKLLAIEGYLPLNDYLKKLESVK